MTSSLTMPPAIAVDANFAIRTILPMEGSTGILERFVSWSQSRSKIYTPDILLPEVVSMIRRGIFDRRITEAEGQIAIEDLFRLGIEFVPSDVELCQAALVWAGRLGQSKAYDGFYLAVAERRGAELWTADERLRNQAQQLGLSWVRWIEDE
jgi:predicted nucleic acid-binding protein